MKKRICALFVSVLLVFGLMAGCTQTDNSGAPTSAGNNTSSTTADSGTPSGDGKTFDVNTVEEFSVLALGGLSFDLNDMDDPVGQEITKNTGVKLNFEFPVGDWNEKLALVIASEDYPDLIGNKDNAMAQLVEAGALVGIKDKIENSPNLKAYLGEKSRRLAYSVEDPEYYGFGSVAMIDDPRPDQYWGIGFGLQFDVLEKAGYPTPKSLEEFEQLIVDYKAANPTINGQPAIGVTLIAADGWRWKISVTNPAFLSTGKADDGEWYIDPQTYKASFHYKDPNEKEYFRWLNHLNDIGLLDPESFTQSYDAYQAKIASGRVIGLIDALWEFDIARKEAENNVGGERGYMTFPILKDPANMVWSADRSDGKVTAGGYMVTKACKNVDKIVNFFDYLSTEEAMILKEWGFEGVHYDIVDGLRVIKPEIKAEKEADILAFRKATGIGRYNDPTHYQPGYGWKTSNGQLVSSFIAEQAWDGMTKNQTDAMTAYNILGFNQMFPPSSAIPESAWGAAWTMPIGQSEEAKVIQGKVEEITLKSIAKAVLAKPADFDAEWDSFINEVDAANISVLEDEVTALVAERMELWGTK